MNTVVETINGAGGAFVDFALPMLVQSSVLVVILLLIDAVLRKRVRAVFRYWIWMLVLAKLVLPASLWSPVSIGRWVGDPLTAPTAALYELSESQPAASAAERFSIAESVLSQDVPASIVRPMLPVGSAYPETVYSEAGLQPESARADMGSEPLPDSAAALFAGPSLSWQGLVLLSWAATAISLLLLLLQRSFFVRGLVAQAEEASAAMQDSLNHCRARIGMRREVALKLSAIAGSPAACGLIHPVILIPQNLAPRLDAHDLQAVLLHELAHIKRGDLWINLAQTLLQIVYFYNPLLWLANAIIRRTREQAVDEAVLVAMGEAAPRYPETLVNVAKLAFRKRPGLSLRLIGVVESKSALTARIRHILNRPLPRTARLGIAGLTIILATAAVLLPMARAQREEAGPFKAVLADGVTVELIGASEHPSVGKPWWRPDGSTLEQAPYDQIGGEVNPDDGRAAFEFAVRVQGLPAGAETTMKTEPEGSRTGGASPPRRDGQPVDDLRWLATVLPRNLRNCTVLFGVAGGEWETIAQSGGVGSSSQSTASGGVSFSPAMDRSDDGVAITVTDDMTDRPCRIVAALQDGTTAESSEALTSSVGKARQTTVSFKNLTLARVADFRFQTRPWTRVEFRNVSLRPGRKSDVQVHVQPADDAVALDRGAGERISIEPGNVGSILEIRVAPKRDDVTADAVVECTKALVHGQTLVGDYLWVAVRPGTSVPPNSIVQAHAGKTWLLTRNQERFTMVPGEEWRLTHVGRSADRTGKPVIVLAFNDRGEANMEGLTESNPGRSLAVIVNGVVVSAAIIPEGRTRRTAVIAGDFTEQEREDMIATLRRGIIEPSTGADRDFRPVTLRRNGVTVELLGICEYPSVGKQWWRPDGSPLPESPYDDEAKAFPKEGEKGYKFAVKFSGLAGKEVDAYIDPSSFKTTHGGGLSSVSSKNGKENTKYWNGVLDEVIVWQGAAFDKELDACDLRVGVSLGPWNVYWYETDEPNDPVEWAVFKNVPLTPRLKTQAQAEVEAAPRVQGDGRIVLPEADLSRYRFPDLAIEASYPSVSEAFVRDYRLARRAIEDTQGDLTESQRIESRRAFEALSRMPDAFPISLYAQRWLIILDWLSGKADAVEAARQMNGLAEAQSHVAQSAFTKAYAATILARDGHLDRAHDVFVGCSPSETPQWGWFASEMDKYFDRHVEDCAPDVSRTLDGRMIQTARTEPQWQAIETELRAAQTAYADYLEYELLPLAVEAITSERAGQYARWERLQIVDALRYLSIGHAHSFSLGTTTAAIKARFQRQITPKILAAWQHSLQLYDREQQAGEIGGHMQEIKARCAGSNLPWDSLPAWWQRIQSDAQNAPLNAKVKWVESGRMPKVGPMADPTAAWDEQQANAENGPVSSPVSQKASPSTDILSAQDTSRDSDRDGLSDFAEIHKYLTDPAKKDSDSDGTPDGDWNERREYTYSVRTVLRYLPPFDEDGLNDDFQDARVLSRTGEYIEIEVIHYPLATAHESVPENPNWRQDYAHMTEFLAPGATTNWDEQMKRDLSAALKADGIDVETLTDKQVVERVSSWLMKRSRSLDNVFTTYYVDFPQGTPRVYPGLEDAFRNEFERDDSKYDWTIEQHFDHELLGKGMFYNKTHGSCTSTAVYLTTVLRALGIPTRMILVTPVVDASDREQILMVKNAITHNRVRLTMLAGLGSSSHGFTNHTLNEVYVGNRWCRLDYSRLGCPAFGPHRFGLQTHLYTLNDLSDANFAPTWGRRYAKGERSSAFQHDNPYSAIAVSESFGAHSNIPNPPFAAQDIRPHSTPDIFLFYPSRASVWQEFTEVVASGTFNKTGRPHQREFYDNVFNGIWLVRPQDVLVLLFSLDTAERIPKDYEDLLPKPWAEIEAGLKRGETVELSGRAREMNIVLLAAPTSSGLKPLVQNSKLLSALGKTGGPSVGTSSQIARTSSTAGSVVRLDNGATVELLGVCEHPSEGKQWWRPDGSPRDKAPYKTTGEVAPAQAGFRMYEFALRLAAPDDAHVYWIVPGGNYGSSTGPPIGHDGERLRELRAYKANEPEGREAAEVRVGVAAGPWQDTVVHTALDKEGSYSLDDGRAVAFGLAYVKDGNACVPVTLNFYPDQMDYQVVALDGEGKSHVAGGSSYGGNVLRSMTCKFGLPLARVKEFRLQVRPWTWTRFENVALRPGYKTDVAVKPQDAKTTTAPSGRVSGAGKVVAIGPAWEALRDEIGECYRGSIGGFSTEEKRCAEYFEKVLSWAGPGDTFMLMFAFDETAMVPAQYQDLLPLSWSEIESRVGKGEKLEVRGMARGLNVVLLAAPMLEQLNALIRRTQLLDAFRTRASEEGKTPAGDQGAGGGALVRSGQTANGSTDGGETAAKLANGVTVRFMAYSQLTGEGLRWWNSRGEAASVPGVYEADVDGLGTILAFDVHPPQSEVYAQIFRAMEKQQVKNVWRLPDSHIWLLALGEQRNFANVEIWTRIVEPPVVGLIPLTSEDQGKVVEVGKFGIVQIADLRVVSDPGMFPEIAEMMGLPPGMPADDETIRSMGMQETMQAMVEPPVIQFTLVQSFDSARSIAAVQDREGLTYPVRKVSGNGRAATYAASIWPDRLASVVIEACPARGSTVRFRNISLTPGHATTVAVETDPQPQVSWQLSKVSLALGRLVRGLEQYQKDHGGRLPASLQALSGYLLDEQSVMEHVAYIGRGGLPTNEPNVPIAYGKTLLPQGQGTYVVYDDRRLQFESPRQLKELGIPTDDADKPQPAPSTRHCMQQLGLAVAMYANDHNGNLPATLSPLEPYVSDFRVIAWLKGNATYVGKGNVKDYPAARSTVTAYEKTAQPTGERYVLFLDAHVELAKPERFRALGLESAARSEAATQPQPAAGALSHSEVTVILGGDAPLGFFYNEHGLWFEVHNRSSDDIEINTNPLDQDESRRGEWGYVEVFTEDGKPVTYTWHGRPSMWKVPPGRRYKVQSAMNGMPLRKSGPGFYKARLTLRVRNVRTDKASLVQSNWHTFRVTPAGRLPGEAQGPYEELQEAEAFAAACGFGHGSRADAIQQLLALTEKYADTKYALAAYFYAANALEHDTGDRAYQAKRREYYREIVKRWPDVVNHHTIFARLHTRLHEPESQFLESRRDAYRWLLSLTEEQKIASIRGYAILPWGEPTDDDVRRILPSVNESIRLTKKMLEESIPGIGAGATAADGHRTELLRAVRTGTTDLRVVLGEPRPYTLSGVVVDERGLGISDVNVTLMEETFSAPDGGKGNPPITARTDATGAFRFDKTFQPSSPLAMGRMLIARKQGYGLGGERVDVTGGVTSVQITLLPEEKVSGTVLNEAGEPIANANVALLSVYWKRSAFFIPPTRSEFGLHAVTGGDGSFTLEQLPTESDLFLRVFAEGYASGELHNIYTGKFGSYGVRRDSGAETMGTNDRDPDAPLKIVLQQAVTFRGSVVYEDTDKPPEGIRVATQAHRLGGWSETLTNEAGQFELKDVSPTPCNLLAMVEEPNRYTMPGWTAAAVTFRDLKPGEIRDGIKLVLTKGGLIRGKATDLEGHPLKGIDIAFHSAAMPESGGAVQYIETRADGTWTYRFPPGGVYIYIRTKFPGAAWQKENYRHDLSAGQVIDGVDFTLDQVVSEDSTYRKGTVAQAAGRTQQGTDTPGPGQISSLLKHYEADGFKFEAGFMPDKTEYVWGEPMHYFTYVIRNTGDAPLSFVEGGDYRGGHSESHQITAVDADGRPVPAPEMPGMGGIIGIRKLQPGEVYTKSMPVERRLTFSGPGVYQVTGCRTLRFAATLQEAVHQVTRNEALRPDATPDEARPLEVLTENSF